MNTTRTALIFATANGYFSSLISLVSVVVLARMLTPSELGIIAIASSIVIIADILKSAGLSSVLIREESLSHIQLRRALGVSVLVSFLLGGVVAILAIPLGSFYNQEALKYMLFLMAIPFFITPFYANCLSIYSRKLMYRTAFKISVLSQTATLAFTILLVLYGFSFYAIPLGSILQSLLFMLLVTQNPQPEFVFRPTLKRSGYFLRSGLSFTIINVLTKYLTAINDLILGRLGSLADVAIYSRGVGLSDYINSTLSMGVRSFALPYLSRSKRETDSMEVDYYLASKMALLINASGLLFAALFAEDLVLLMFGSQWIDSIQIAQYFCIFMFLLVLVPFFSQVLVIEKKEKVLIPFLLLIFTLICANLVVSFPYGLVAIAKNMMWIGCLYVILQLVILQIAIKYRIINYVSEIWPTILIISAGVFIGFITKEYLTDATHLARLIIAAICVGLTLLFIVVISRHPIHTHVIRVFMLRYCKKVEVV